MRHDKGNEWALKIMVVFSLLLINPKYVLAYFALWADDKCHTLTEAS
jgi:hypothetical protein